MLAGIKKIIHKMYQYYKIGELNNTWRKRNTHNYTNILRRCNIDLISVGKATYGGLNVHDFCTGETLTIGNYCSIAEDVHFYLGGDHEYRYISTYPFRKNILLGGVESISKGNIVVKDDVWIGSHSIVLSGVTIGQGCIIAAGSVVSKSLEPYSIVGGVPAKVLKKRLSNQIIKELENFDYSNLSEREIANNLDLLYSDISLLSEEELSIIIGKIFKGK